MSSAAFLHILATHPQKLIPPGKSLRAALLHPDAPDPPNDSDIQTLQTTVEEIVHRAFWDEARDSLVDPTPSRQLARLHLLYTDLYTALAPLLPKTHPSILTLTDPLSPTPAPLLSARRHLTELTSALLTRCAPIRDSLLFAIRADLQLQNDDAGAPNLAERIVNAVRELLRIAEVMKKDLKDAVLGAVSDEDLEVEVVRSARVEERRAVIELYGVQGVRERWNAWLSEDGADNADAWIRQLVNALGADVAISCPLPSPSPNSNSEQKQQSDSSVNTTQPNANALPPPFLLSAPDLFHLQNHIQALVIAAVLRTLVPLRPAASSISTSSASSSAPLTSTSSSTPAHTARASYLESQKQNPEHEHEHEQEPEDRTFASRVLALLMLEVDSPEPEFETTQDQDQDVGSTKLINLADEVLREHRRLMVTTSSTSSSSSSASTSSSEASSNTNTNTNTNPNPNPNNPPPSSPPAPPPPQIDEKSIRARVDLLLQPTNGVFVLLRKRLLVALVDGVLAALSLTRQRAMLEGKGKEKEKGKGKGKGKGNGVPEMMRTGRERERKRPKLDGFSLNSSLSLSLHSHSHSHSHSNSETLGALRRALDEITSTSTSTTTTTTRAWNVNGNVNVNVNGQPKGFEDPVLRRGVGEAMRELADVVEWVVGTWAGNGNGVGNGFEVGVGLVGLEGLEEEGEGLGGLEGLEG